MGEMTAPIPTEVFLDSVRKSGLVEEAHLAGCLAILKTAGPLPDDPSSLADHFVAEGLLTYFQAEQLLQGKWNRFNIASYLVLERLDCDSTGSYYLCQHPRVRRLVKIKVFPSLTQIDRQPFERFNREGRAMATFSHLNIVRLYDASGDELLPYLAMEFVDGVDLKAIVLKHGPMDIIRASHYIRQAASGLEHIHNEGWVHRNIKPSNLILDRYGTVKICGMNLAYQRQDDAGESQHMFEDRIVGTPEFMAPEQAVRASVDHRADLYSLGLTFYFLLTRQIPFVGGTITDKLLRQQFETPEPIRSFRPEVPDPLAEIIEKKLLAKEPTARYYQTSELAEALGEWTCSPLAPPPASEMPTYCPRIGALLEASR
jgi:serine/threonine protein kinase